MLAGGTSGDRGDSISCVQSDVASRGTEQRGKIEVHGLEVADQIDSDFSTS